VVFFPSLYSQVLYFPAHKTHFFPEKYDLNATCVLYAEGKHYFQNYKYPYIYYTSLSWDSENNHEDDFSGSDDDLLGFYDEKIILWLLILACNNPVFLQ